jgi:hypothetical protein
MPVIVSARGFGDERFALTRPAFSNRERMSVTETRVHLVQAGSTSQEGFVVINPKTNRDLSPVKNQDGDKTFASEHK